MGETEDNTFPVDYHVMVSLCVFVLIGKHIIQC